MMDAAAIQELLAAGAAADARGIEANGKTFIVTPSEYRLTEIHGERPQRTIVHRQFADVPGFLAYFRQFGDGTSLLFANQAAGTVHAEIDGPPFWREHLATLTLGLSLEAAKWDKMNGKPMEQTAMAEFIEDQAPAFVKPNAATMLEIAETISISSSGRFDARVNRQNGATKLSFTEEIDGKAGKAGDLTIPDMFTVDFPIFPNSAPVNVDARFRYRLTGGKLTLHYNLIRWDEIKQKAFDAAVMAIAEATGQPVMHTR